TFPYNSIYKMLNKEEIQDFIKDFFNQKVKKLNEISLIKFLNYCKIKLANKGSNLVYKEKLLIHQLYSNKLKTKWNKKFMDIQLGDALRIFQQQIEDGDYLILQFWADIAKPHTQNNNTDILSNVQTAIYSCTDKTQLLTTINYLKNISEVQIKEILLRAEIQKKRKNYRTIYKLSNIKPQWFFKKLKELGKIKEKLLELPITDPFYCFIVNFNSEIWRPIYQRNAILRIENDCLLKILMEQYDDINNAMDIVFEKYNPNFEPSTKIELNSDLEDLYKNYSEVTERNIISDEITNCLQPILNSESYNDDVRVYPRKVDTAITYTYKGYSLYLLMCEVKLPNASNCGVYNKLIRSLNDSINNFIIFFSKTAKIITSELKLLFSKMKWVGLFVF
ncbi:8020_t:CDS:2, partial [Gigaspora margarita]